MSEQLELIQGTLRGLPSQPETREQARDRAALRVVAGYEQALTCLHPDDVDEQRWYRDQLRDARLAAGLAPVAGLPSALALHRALPG